MKDQIKTSEILYAIENLKPARSAWGRGVQKYAYDLVDGAYFLGTLPTNYGELKNTLLDNANSWHEYAFGGNGLVYNEAIAERLCTPSELKRTDHGNKQPNSRESWLEVEARALNQAFNLVARVVRDLAQD